MTPLHASKKLCAYCNGTGYLQLLLGGTETCDHCQGAGTAAHSTQAKQIEKQPLIRVFHMVLNSWY